MNTNEQLTANKKIFPLIVAASIAVIVVVIIAVCIFFGSGSSEKRLQAQLDLGCKYLEELNYEQAIAAFDVALSIDPKNEQALAYMSEAYLVWAESEYNAGNHDRALEILHEGYEKTSDSGILDMINAVDKIPESYDSETEATDETETIVSLSEEEIPYRNLADDIWRLIDFQYMGKSIPAWTSEDIEAFILQNYPNPVSEQRSEDGGLYYEVNDEMVLLSFAGCARLDVSNGARYSISFRHQVDEFNELDMMAIYITSADDDILNQYPIFGMMPREYLDGFGLGYILEDHNAEKMVYFSDTEYVRITYQQIEVKRNVKHGDNWDTEEIVIFYPFEEGTHFSDVQMFFSMDTEAYYN